MKDRGKRFTLSPRGSQVLEAYANGLRENDIELLLCISSHAVKVNARTLYDRLAIGGSKYKQPQNRAIAMAAAAGLLLQSDLKMPGQVFDFTMTSRPESLIDIQGVTPSQNKQSPFLMNQSDRRLRSRVLVTAEQRTIFSHLALGMSFNQIPGDLDRSKSQTRRINHRLGFVNSSHTLAYLSTNGVVSIDPRILEDGDKAQPTIYEEGVVISLERPAFDKFQPLVQEKVAC